MAMNNTAEAMRRAFRQELKQRSERIKREIVKEATERFHAELVKIAANITLDLDEYFSVEKLQDNWKVTMEVKEDGPDKSE